MFGTLASSFAIWIAIAAAVGLFVWYARKSAVAAGKLKHCPHCRELIDGKATACKHCGRDA